MRGQLKRIRQQDKLFDALIDLKRHLRTCRQCVAAKKASDPTAMCRDGIFFTFKAAMGYDDVIRLRTKAYGNPGGTVFACPDVTKHGKAYALTAPAMLVTGVQDTLL